MSDFEPKPEPKQISKADAKVDGKRPASEPAVVRGGGGDPRPAMYRPASEQHADVEEAARPLGSAAAGFTLEPAVKDNLLNDIPGRTSRAYIAYMTAITELKVAEMIKQDEQIGVFTEIVMGALFGAVGAGLIGALKDLKSVKKVQDALKALGSKATNASLKHGIEEVSEKSLEITVGSVLDVGKDHAKEGIKKAGGAGGEPQGAVKTEKTAALRYLTALQTSGAQLFQEMAENVTQHLDDSELLAYWSALDARYQNAPAYHEMIEKGLDRYMSVDAHNIGRTRIRSPDPDSLNYAIRETRVAWLVDPKTGTKQLIYVHRDFDELQVEIARTSTFATHSKETQAWDGADGDGAMSYATDYVKDNKSDHVQSLEADDFFAGFVEPDMIDTALQLHEETWRYPPRTYSYAFLAKAMQPDIAHGG